MNAHEIVERLKEVCQTKRIRWDLHNCSLCDVPVGYIFQGGNAYFDSMCDCSWVYHDPEPRTWEDVESTISMNIDHDIVKKLLKLMEV